MSIARIIEFLSSELARHGSDLLSAADLSSLAATVIPEMDLKGIGRSYTVRHLLPPEDLRAIWDSATRNELLAKTAEKLPRGLGEGIRKTPDGNQWTFTKSAKIANQASDPDDLG